MLHSIQGLKQPTKRTVGFLAAQLLPELQCPSRVNDTIDFTATRVEVRLQGENDVVWHAEAFADDWQCADSGLGAVLLNRYA